MPPRGKKAAPLPAHPLAMALSCPGFLPRAHLGTGRQDTGAKEGDEKEMGGITLRAVKASDGSIVFKPVTSLAPKPGSPPQPPRPCPRGLVESRTRAPADV